MSPALRALLAAALALSPLAQPLAGVTALGPPFLPEPSDLALPSAGEAIGGATDPVLLHATFDGWPSLEAEGWTVELLRGPRPGFALEPDARAAAAGVDGLQGGAARPASADGSGYARGLDARLRSPVLDLRHVPRLDAAPPDAPWTPVAGELATRAANATGDARAVLDGGDGLAAHADPAAPGATGAEVSSGDALATRGLWPPGADERVGLAPRAAGAPGGEPALPAARLAVPASPDGLARLRLVVRHAWDFAPADGGFLEARVLLPEGGWSPWSPIALGLPWDAAVEAGDALPSRRGAGYTGALPTGEAAFTGATAAAATSVVPLEALAGRVAQVAFHVRSASPVPPQGFGWAIDEVEVRGALGPPDLAVEGFFGLPEGAAVALGAQIVPEAVVRNHGALAVARATVELDVRDARGNASLQGYPAKVEVAGVAPGEARRVPFPAALAEAAPRNLTLAARIVPDPARPDARPADDAAELRLAFADVPRLFLSLKQPRAAAVTEAGVPKTFTVLATTAGNAAPPGRLVLLVEPLGGGTPREAARLAYTPPSPAGAVLGAPAPVPEEGRAELRWTPGSADAGGFAVRARWTAGAHVATSPPVATWVGASPPPVVATAFPPPDGATRPQPAASAARLDGWSFDGWVLEGPRVVRLAPEAPSAPRAFVGRAADAWGEPELGALAHAGRRADQAATLDLALPAALAPVVADPALAAAVGGIDLSAARLFLTARPVLCGSPPVACGDPSARREVPLAAVWNATVWSGGLGAAGGPLRVEVEGGRIRSGGADGGALYVVVNATLAPGFDPWVGALEVRRDGEALPLVSGGRLVPYDDGGEVRCCILGPLSAEALLGGQAPPPGASALAPPPRPSFLAATAAAGRYVLARDLADFLAAADANATGRVLALEHRGDFAWADGAGVRGHAEVRGPLGEVVATVTFGTATRGWEPLRLALPAGPLPGPLRLMLTLERADPRNLTHALPGCPYLDPAADCEAAATWAVDDLRLLEADRRGWRVAARDTLDDAGAATRWTGDAPAAAAAPSLLGPRGWSLEAAQGTAPHRFHLVAGGARDDGTLALRWGEPGSPRTATGGALWSVARTPPVEVAGLAAPTVSFRARYDLGPQRDGRYVAGVALVAALEDPTSGAVLRRVLLVPDEGAEGGAYRGDVDAGAFAGLARALRVEVPAGAAATAFVGASGRALDAAGGEAGWVRVEADLSPLREALAGARVAIEVHAVATEALRAPGFVLDDLRLGERGPARDLAVARIASPRHLGEVAAGEPVALAVEVANEGLLDAAGATVEVAVLDAQGRQVHPAGDAPLVLPLPASGPGAAPPGGTWGDPARTLVAPQPWTPGAEGAYTVVAHLRGGADEVPANDAASAAVRVRTVAAARLDVPEGGLASGGPLGAAVDEPVALRVGVTNAGTLRFDGARPLRVRLDVQDPAGASILGGGLAVDAAAQLGRALLPGERAEVAVAGAWTPVRAGVYRVVASLLDPGLAADGRASVAAPLVVEERLPLDPEAFRPAGEGWTNATRGLPPSRWSWAPGDDGAEGALDLEEPLNLRSAQQARLVLEHRFAFEEGFDGGRLEASLDGITWWPVPPADGDAAWAPLVEPAALAPGDGRPAAFTGDAAARRTTFDLAAVAALRERVPFAATGPQGDAPPAPASLAFEPAWLGPAAPAGTPAWYAPPAPAPSPPDGDAAAHVRWDFLAFPLTVPEGAGDLRVAFQEWRALGLPGDASAPPSGARVYIEGRGGMRLHPASLELPAEGPYRNNYRDWRAVEAVFPGAGAALAGGAATLVVEHREVAPAVPPRFTSPGREVPRFASDLVSPHGGHAVAGLRAEAATAEGKAGLPLGAPSAGQHEAWLAPGEALPEPALPALGPPGDRGYRALVGAPAVWRPTAAGGWRAEAAAAPFADARLVAPLDLTAAVAEVALVLRERRALALLEDAATGASGAASAAGVMVSDDGGATWTPVPPRPGPRAGPVSLLALDGSPGGARHSAFAGPGADPEGDSPFGPGGRALGGDAPGAGEAWFDLSAFGGRPVLVALHASFATAPHARGDFWEVEAARVEADVLRGDEVRLRLRAASDATGRSGGWDVLGAEARVVRHGDGAGVRLLAPAPGPLSVGFHVLEAEVVNRGPSALPPLTLRVEVEEPPEQGGARRAAVRPVPALGPGEATRVRVRGVDLNWALAAGVSPARVALSLEGERPDALALDDAVVVRVGGPAVVERTVLAAERLAVRPHVLDLTDHARRPVTITATARNVGDAPAALAPSSVRVLAAGAAPGVPPLRELEDATPPVARVAPNGTVDVSWTWKPASFLAHGLHTVEARVATGSAQGGVASTVAGTVLTGGPFLEEFARLERFGAAPGRERERPGWTCASPPPCAAEDGAVARSAPASLAVGPPGAEGRAVVESPVFPARWLPSPALAMHVRHALAPGEEARVSAAPVRAGGAVGEARVVAVLVGTSAGFGEGRFAEVRVPLDPGAGEGPVEGYVLAIDAPPGRGGLPALWVDDVSVTPLDAAVEVPPAVPVADAVEKRLRFRVRNLGALGDTYAVAFGTEAGPALLPRGWAARVEDPRTGAVLATHEGAVAGAPPLDVAPGEARALDLVVAVPPSAGASPLRGPVRLPLLLRSELLPSLVRAAVAEVEARGAPRPDVAVADVRVRGLEAPAGQPRVVEVAVANRGLVAAEVEVEALVEPPRGVAEPSAALAPAGGGAATLRLPPGAVRTMAFAWTPRHAGDHVLRVAADPAGRLVEADRADNRAERAVPVPSLPFPDLRVTVAFDGEPLAGRPVEVRLAVENVGTVAARGVEVEARAGVVALADPSPLRLDDLAPGATWNGTLPWVPAIPGNVTLVATAFAREGAPEPVATLADNAALVAARVREEAARLEAVSSEATARGGEPAELRFRVANAGNAPEAYALRLDVPEDWAYALDVAGAPTALLRLAAGERAEVVARVLPPPDAAAGEVPVALVATAASTGAAHRAEGALRLGGAAAILAALADEGVRPSDAAVELDLTNLGRSPLRWQVRRAALPDGWTLLGAAADLPPLATTRVRLALDLGEDAAPATVPFRLDWVAGADGADGRVGGALRLLPEPRLEARAEARAVAGGAGELVVALRNVGNAAWEGEVAIGLPEGVTAARDAAAAAVPPGQGREVRVPLWASADARDGAPVVVTLRAPASPPLAINATLAIAATDLAVTLLPGVGPAARPGDEVRVRVAVANRGTAAARGVTAELHVDGGPAATVPLGDLPPGAVADAELAWKATPGDHALAVAASHLGGLRDADPDDNAVAVPLRAEGALDGVVRGLVPREVAGGGPALLVLALAAAALFRPAAGRRRP